jgi:hypothetical protein
VPPRRSVPRDLACLSVLCGLVYFTGLTTHGLTNWQEAQRAQVAREMQQAGDWVVPRIEGRPYLNKPPMIYWCQLALASLRGSATGELDLRLTVALAGWLGVLGTYIVTRGVLRPVVSTPDPERAAWGDDAAWWSSLFLATGLLYVRSSRIGELDILLVPFTVTAVGAIHAAWRSYLHLGRTNWAAVLLAAAAACGSMLTKGPPGLLVIVLAGYGGMLLWASWQVVKGAGPTTDPVQIDSRRCPPAVAVISALAGLGLAVVAAALSRTPPLSLAGLGGLGMFALIGAGGAATLARLALPGRCRALFAAWSRTHPLIVVLAPVGALALWGWAVATRLGGTAAIEGTIRGEANDNLRPLVLESPLNNLEASGYGVGLGSIATLIGVVWLWRRRPTLPIGWWMLAAWVLLGLAAFSVSGKGVPRYLTPLWPGIAIVGGSWLAWRVRRGARPRMLAAAVLVLVAVLAMGQAWWYGWGREHPPAWIPDQSAPCPRAFLEELLAPGNGVDPARLGTFEFDTPQMDYYVGRAVPSYMDSDPKPNLAGVGPATILDIRGLLSREGGSYTLLIRRSQPAILDSAPAEERLREAGFHLEVLPIRARFTIDKGRTEIAAARISLR